MNKVYKILMLCLGVLGVFAGSGCWVFGDDGVVDAPVGSDDTGVSLARPYVPGSSNQLLNLHGVVRPAVPVKDISWPANPGEAEVCLWMGDKVAAASITIDDNWGPDHSWWVNLCSNLGIRVTWFVITGQLDGRNPGFNGTWADYARLVAAGHDVQSHTVSHYATKDPADIEKCRAEYAGSIRDIEKNIPGHRCLAMAYPMGVGLPVLASRYFIAVRGVTGTPSVGNQINYMNTEIGNGHPDAVNSILGRPTPDIPWLGNPKWRRGWIQPLYHGAANYGRTKEEIEANKQKATAEVENLARHKDLIWIDTFVTVAKYAQERDSATLRTVASGGDAIRLELNDLMRDDIFDQPLTLKVRLPDGWTTVKATQGGRILAATLAMHEGVPYALVDAVPDRGLIDVLRH